MLCVVNAHQSLAVEFFGGFRGKEKKGQGAGRKKGATDRCRRPHLPPE